jgi:RimJ/RimL family protein N-acetyltransferase
MTHDINALGQPVGPPIGSWTSPPFPERVPMHGRSCRVEPLDPAAHAESLFAANALDTGGAMWTYLGYGPFATLDEYTSSLARRAAERDPQFYAIVDQRTGRAVGVASYLRIDPPNGVIEVGHLAFSPLLQRTVAATEAMYLMMARAFELGYRRYEWKCDALNAPSRRAATRLGLNFEGIFRQAVVTKGRSRDTAWYAAIDSDWPRLDAAFRQWLDPRNFDDHGRQRVALSALMMPVAE